MTNDLLEYYRNELDFFRNQVADFAKSHSTPAEYLGLSQIPGKASDPHIERLIEAFAFLNARIRHKLDDDFPELAQALLQVAYPHYLAPVPSMGVARFEIDPSQPGPAFIKPQTPLETVSRSDGPPSCKYRTCYPVELLPLSISQAELKRPPFKPPTIDRRTGEKVDAKIQSWTNSQTQSILVLRLESASPEGDLAGWDLNSLRFFINAADHAGELYELILNNTLAVALVNSDRPNEAVLLPKECLAPVGFNADESMLPMKSRSFPGFALLMEFFAFPQKFLFFDLFFDPTVHAVRDLSATIRRECLKERHQDLDRVSRSVRNHLGKLTDIVFFLNRAAPTLEPAVSHETFSLGCTPIINLFSDRTADAERMSHLKTEYPVVADHSRREMMEIYSIDRVWAKDPNGKRVEYKPFYSFAHAPSAKAQQTFWHAVRRPASAAAGDGVDHGTEMSLSLVDLTFKPSQQPDWILQVETTCLNRDVPDPDPQRFGRPRLQCYSENAISSIVWLEGPTKTLRPGLDKGLLWRLISHLNLNHLSLTAPSAGGGDKVADAFKETLAIYNFADSDETRQMIDGIVNVKTSRDVGRTREGLSGGLCRGVKVEIEFDETKFAGQSVYLLASVIERFLALYCSINSFSRLVATTSNGRKLRTWSPRAGDRPLLGGNDKTIIESDSKDARK